MGVVEAIGEPDMNRIVLSETTDGNVVRTHDVFAPDVDTAIALAGPFTQKGTVLSASQVVTADSAKVAKYNFASPGIRMTRKS